MVTASWFLLGTLVGSIVTEILVYVVLRSEEEKCSDEEFVKKLVQEKGWKEARWELEFSFNGKYMRTWRRLYKKHIEGKNDGSN